MLKGRLGKSRIISGGWLPDSSWQVPFWCLEAYRHFNFYFVYIPRFRWVFQVRLKKKKLYQYALDILGQLFIYNTALGFKQ